MYQSLYGYGQATPEQQQRLQQQQQNGEQKQRLNQQQREELPSKLPPSAQYNQQHQESSSYNPSPTSNVRTNLPTFSSYLPQSHVLENKQNDPSLIGHPHYNYSSIRHTSANEESPQMKHMNRNFPPYNSIRSTEPTPTSDQQSYSSGFNSQDIVTGLAQPSNYNEMGHLPHNSVS
ncbi:hypothetical protein K501DRAFT_281243, partial [Backusella circina FSU 941]